MIFLRRLALSVLLCAQAQAAPPNILLILIDDLGYGDLACYGSPLHQTPHLDRLAAAGMTFTDFHSNGAVCSPTRAALMTGQYQQRSGIEAAIGFTLDEGMPLGKTALAELLAPAGYRCAVFGKWHLGHVSRFGPNDQGFHHSVVSNNTPDYHTHISRVGELDWFHDHLPTAEPGYLTELVRNHTTRFIRENKDRPFFLFVSHIAVHFPFQGPTDPAHREPGKIWHDEKYGPLPKSEYQRAYKDMLEAVDTTVGQAVATLDELGLTQNTFIFVTSDNGAYAWVGSNAPFRGEKTEVYEGGHRVPAIACWPGRIPAGSVTSATTLTMDVMPTVLSLADIEKPADLPLDGIDFSPVLLRGETLPERTLFWRHLGPKGPKAVRLGPWKLVVPVNQIAQLFHLGDDPGETTDLAQQLPQQVDVLWAELASWERQFAR